MEAFSNLATIDAEVQQEKRTKMAGFINS